MTRKTCTFVLGLVVASTAACDGIDKGGWARTNVGAEDVTNEPPGAPADPSPAASRWLHTQGASIVDADGQVVRLTGISWFGLETSSYAPHGLWARSLDAILDDVVALGYNMLRIPFATQMLDAASMPSGIDAKLNPSLAGKKPIEVLDAVVAGAGKRGLRVVLDRHRPDAAAQSALWYTDTYSEQRWIDDWTMLAKRYKDDPTVIGFDLHNEPHGKASWGDDVKITDWRLAAERAGAAVQAENPELLVIVEGVETIDGKGGWWGGNLRNAGKFPVRLPVADHLVYSTHDYPASVSPQTWLSAADFPKNLPGVWDETFGYLVAQDVAPVWIGELGTKYATTADKQWLDALAKYITDRKMSFAFWCLNPDSTDTGGILKDDWTTPQADKQAVVSPLLAPAIR